MQKLMFFLISIVFVVGCSVLSPRHSLINTPSFTSTLSILSTVPPTFIGTMPMTATTPVPTLEWEPPVLPLDESYVKLKNLLETNANCRLPCWWGIVPGETTWKEAEIFLSEFNSISNPRGDKDYFAITIHLPLPKDLGTLSHNYYIKNDIVVGVDAYVYDWSPFIYLSSVLTEYGPPDEIFITTYRNKLNGMRPYLVYFIYEQLSMLLEYSGGSTENTESKVKNCFEDMYSPFIYIWSTNEPLTSQEALEKYFRQPMAYPVKLEDATGMSVSTFYETFKKPSSANCLTTPIELWTEQ